MTSPLRPLAAVTALLLAGASLSGCSTTPGGDDTASASGECGTFPYTLTHAFGTSTLDTAPERVAVVTDVDLDIALALGLEPVIYPGYDLGAWQAETISERGLELESYDPADGIDFEAIAAAAPDAILATSGWSLDEDYDKLSSIAPVIAYTSEDGLDAMTWIDRTELAGCALGLVDEATAAIDDVQDAFAQAAADHPEFSGKTITYAVIHPDQITYSSYEGSDVTFFTDLGFTLPETAAEFTSDTAGLSKENLDKLEADVLVIGFPFGGEGLMSRDELETDPLFQSLDVVQRGAYGVIGEDVASPIAYPSPLGLPWALENVLPVLADAAN
ncbi:ABC transporter substrate-binding protein [Microbacterium sp. 2C]|uniref:ABC transporter substrate-binding protein n=1 Tax=Micrococcales TaxID=85006 RepID=UPI0018C21977|nr:ABC transporter substrate-binding protein [Microbacterium paulum]MBG0717226.1 ABC transporter substrate-binding protein [Microbacterium paulum]